MTVSLSNIKQGSLVHRFITSGKPGNCKFCFEFVDKLEAHHICYSPQITISLCHHCHHRVHFWTQRLAKEEIIYMLKLRFHHQTALKIYNLHKSNPISFKKYIAPSKIKFLKDQEKLQINRISPKNKKVFKAKVLLKNKNISKKVIRHSRSSLLSDKKLR